MMVYYSDNPARDFARRDADQQAWEDSLPHCECCGEPLDEYVWNIDDQILCDDCAREKYRRDVEDFVGGDGS